MRDPDLPATGPVVVAVGGGHGLSASLRAAGARIAETPDRLGMTIAELLR